MRILQALVLSWLVAGCAAADDRPSSWREVCEQNAAVDCALEARQASCAGRTAEAAATCEASFVMQCCAMAGDCEASPSFQAATFGEFEQCRAAIAGLACSAVDSGTRPEACEGVVK